MQYYITSWHLAGLIALETHLFAPWYGCIASLAFLQSIHGQTYDICSVRTDMKPDIVGWLQVNKLANREQFR